MGDPRRTGMDGGERVSVTDPALALRTKRCVRCHETKPWGDFFAQQRWDDGTMRRPRSLCKHCDRERRRLNQRKVRAQIAEDPARMAEYRRKEREYNATYRRKKGKKARLHIIDIGAASEVVPVAPLVSAILAKESRMNPDRHGHDRSLLVLLERCSLHERVFRRWRSGEATSTSIDRADRVLIGLDLLWWDVWPPDEYPAVAAIFDPEAVAA